MSTGYSVDFLGCKVSQTDAEQIAETLGSAGHHVDTAAPIQVVNTCCITAEAESKSRRRVRQLIERDPGARVFVTGCGSALHGEAWAAISDRVTVLPGGAAAAAAHIVLAADSLAGLGCKGTIAPPPPGTRGAQRTRAFIKVQDGCSFECSYCVVPIVRGDTRSRGVDAVLADVRRRVAQGRREIVLTGINIGLFRDPELRSGLPRLLTAVAETEGVARVRISSIEINHVNRTLVGAMAQLPTVCAHLHVPLQSGDPGVLRDMRRHYDADGYLRAIDRARSAMPELHLTSDVIVGYPTEDEAAFSRTLAVAEQAGFTRVHAFPYSPRPGTQTADADPVSRAVKADRSKRLRAAADRRARDRWASLVGSDCQLLVEPRAGGTELGGYLADYSPVAAVDSGGSDVKLGQLVPVTVTGVREGGVAVRVGGERSG